MELQWEIWVALYTGICIAVYTDLSKHRIPNGLVLGMILAGLILNTCLGSGAGFFQAISGLSIGLICFLPFHLFGAMGAGDVKLLSAIGTLVGPGNVFTIAVMTVVAGGVVALGYIVMRGGLFPMLRRYHSMLILLMAGRPQYLPPAEGEAAGMRFPYALAIACGTALALWHVL